MAQAKKKTATKTAKKTTRPQARKQASTRTAKKQCVSRADKMHIYIVTVMAMIAGILLCANAAMMIV